MQVLRNEKKKKNWSRESSTLVSERCKEKNRWRGAEATTVCLCRSCVMCGILCPLLMIWKKAKEQNNKVPRSKWAFEKLWKTVRVLIIIKQWNGGSEACYWLRIYQTSLGLAKMLIRQGFGTTDAGKISGVPLIYILYIKWYPKQFLLMYKMYYVV